MNIATDSPETQKTNSMQKPLDEECERWLNLWKRTSDMSESRYNLIASASVLVVVILIILLSLFPSLFSLFPSRSQHSLSPLIIKYADRIPINQPNTPKTYGQLLDMIGVDGMKVDQKNNLLPSALLEVLRRAEASKDLDLLIVLWDSDTYAVELNAKLAMFRALPDEKIIDAFSNGLNNREVGIEFDSTQGIGYLVDLVQYNKQPPDRPGSDEFEKRAPSLITEWREWWADNREAIMERVHEADSTSGTSADFSPLPR